MTELIRNSAFLGVLISLASYAIGIWLRNKTRLSFLNPLLISIILVIAFLSLSGMSYETYASGSYSISFLLTPATICLAVPLYEQFNLQKPVDFHSPSMSVSDIVAIKQNGQVSCHYCDSFGFEQVPGFLPDNPLKNAEMAVEDDYGMIDGIINNGPKEPTVAQLEQQARSGQPISLMDLAAATHREEREKKKSVMEQLKSQPKAEHKKTAPKKSAEREI